MAFGWVRGSAAFQMMSYTVIHIMAKEKCQIFAYIDDFILVSEETDSDPHFDKLSASFTELGLPMNIDKRSPPTRSLTCLGITIGLDNNSLSIDKDKLEEIYAEWIKVRGPSTLSVVDTFSLFWVSLSICINALSQLEFLSTGS